MYLLFSMIFFYEKSLLILYMQCMVPLKKSYLGQKYIFKQFMRDQIFICFFEELYIKPEDPHDYENNICPFYIRFLFTYKQEKINKGDLEMSIINWRPMRWLGAIGLPYIVTLKREVSRPKLTLETVIQKYIYRFFGYHGTRYP